MGQQEGTRAIEPEDLFRLQFIQGARLSPDGKQVVFAVSHVEKETAQAADEEDSGSTTETEHTALWLISLETDETRQFTSGAAKDSHASWSPDGKQIAFLSTRGERPQIYVIPVNGGEARQLTLLEQGVGGGPVWSPDGQQIAFTAGPQDKPPGPDEPYRVSRPIYRFDALGYLDNAVQDLYVIPAEGGEPRRLTDDGWHYYLPLWSPDGSEILVNAAMRPDTHEALLSRLRTVSLDGTAREVTGDWGAIYSGAWSPYGGRIVFCGTPDGQPIGTKSDLWVVDSNGGDPECCTAGLKIGVGGGLQGDAPELLDNRLRQIFVTADGAAAYIQAQDGGTVPIYRVALSGPESLTAVVTGERSATPWDISGEHLLFAASTLNSPVDLFLADYDGGNERQLTRLNAELLASRDLPSVEHLLFHGSDGQQVEGWVLKPREGKAPYPTILYIHGGPHSGFGHTFSFDFQMLAGAGYAVLFVNQRGSTGYGNDFATQIIGDWGNLDYHDLMAGVDFAIEKGIADPARLGCCGISGGGNLSCWIVGQTDRFKAAVPENPVTNWVSFYGISDIGPWFAVNELGGHPHEIPEVYRRCSPITYAHRCKTPTLLVQGEEDHRCPPEQSEQFYTVLKVNNCPVEMLRLPASSHGGSVYGELRLRRVQNEALLDWMNRYVLAEYA